MALITIPLIQKLIASLFVIAAAIIGGFGDTLPSSSPKLNLQPTPLAICVARWHWDTADAEFNFWRTPYDDNTFGVLDLRSNTDAGFQGLPARGYGIFALDSDSLCTGPDVLVELDGDIDAAARPLEKTALEIGLGLTAGSLTGATIKDVIVELYVEEGDPTGINRWKPIRGSWRRGYKLNFEIYGDLVNSPVLTAQVRQNTIDIFQADFRRREAEGETDSQLQKMVGFEMLKLFGSMSDGNADIVMPSEHRNIGWARPATTLNDTFVEDSGDLDLSLHEATPTTFVAGDDNDWTKIEGDHDIEDANDDVTIFDSSNARARAEGDISGDDMDVEIEIITYGSTSSNHGPIARYASGADTNYAFLVQDNGTNTFRLFEITAGSFSQVGCTVSTTAPTVPFTARLRVTDGNLEGFIDDVSVITGSDPSITGNTKGGFIGRDNRVDDYQIADVSTAARRIIIISKIEPPTPGLLDFPPVMWSRRMEMEALLLWM